MTEATYLLNLKKIEIDDPSNLLLKTLKKGYSIVNALLMQRVLTNLVEKTEETDDDDDETNDTDVDDSSDDILRNLRIEQRRLYTDRRKLSNKFHLIFKDSERRDTSEEIQIIQKLIERTFFDIKFYKKNKELPEREKYPIPKDPLELASLRLSLRASISRKKREIELLGFTPEPKPTDNADKLKKAESKLQELRNHLQYVQKAIENRNLQNF